MAKKNLCCCETPEQDDGPAMELPQQIQEDLNAIGGIDTLTKRIPPQAELERRGKIYQALSDPLRLTILYIIRDQPLCVCVINRFMRLSGSKLSYHLTILKEAGLIEGTYEGNWIIYTVTERGRKLLHCTEHAGK
jgi:ArsR family transcriptional regulator